MNTQTPYSHDAKTLLLDRYGRAPRHVALTDSEPVPRIENIDERIVYNAQLKPTEHISVGLNPLIAAARDVLSFVVGIDDHRAQNDLLVLHALLSTEIKAFETNALHAGCESGQVITARYVLCTVLDEAICTTVWGNELDWSQKSLLGSFHNETFGGEKVFQLIERFSREPAKNLYLLELLYVCLSLGFEGRFRVESRGTLELESIRDNLYRQIRHLRGDVIREVSPHWQGLNAPRSSAVRLVPRWLWVTFTLSCLTVMYTGFAWVLSQQREAVMQPYEQHVAADQPAVANRKS